MYFWLKKINDYENRANQGSVGKKPFIFPNPVSDKPNGGYEKRIPKASFSHCSERRSIDMIPKKNDKE